MKKFQIPRIPSGTPSVLSLGPMIGHYTPDGIHIYSEWWFFVPTGVILTALLLFVAYIYIRPHTFRRRKWLPSLVIVLGMLLAAASTYDALGKTFFSVPVSDYLAEGQRSAGIIAYLSEFRKIKFPEGATVRAAVQSGSRGSTEWIAIEGDASSLPDQLLKLGYKKHEIKDYQPEERLLEPIGNWIRESQFQPDLNFTNSEPRGWKSFQIDHSRGLVLVTIIDA